mgnify:CR=1 FL=1
MPRTKKRKTKRKKKKSCIFCKIVAGETDTEILYENENLAVFWDINPKAPVHLLIVPKKHIETIHEVSENEKEILGDLLFVAGRMAKKMKIDKGYKLLFNIGKKAGQEIDHIHLHLMGGWKKPQ